LLTEAAAAKSAAPLGKNMAIRASRVRLFTSGRSSTAAALPAAQRPARADVNGKIDPARAPWLAYVSAIAAARALTETYTVIK
jgi:hypothetical protein